MNDLAQSLKSVCDMADMPPPEGPDILPVVQWGNDISIVAQRLGAICTRLPIFKYFCGSR